jgi:hypothetical protein
MEPLDELLAAAKDAGPGGWINFRARIAAHGSAAIEMVAPLTNDVAMGGFAVRVIGDAAKLAKAEAIEALLGAARVGARALIRQDAIAELIRLGAAEALSKDQEFEILETGAEPDGRRFVRFRTRAQATGSFTLREAVMAALGLKSNPWVELEIDCCKGHIHISRMKLESQNEVYRRLRDQETHELDLIGPYEDIVVVARPPRAHRAY